ncbi:MAG: tRNA (guanosine(37)-N1)-methyltransferase TrmD [Chloroflexota bacterium]
MRFDLISAVPETFDSIFGASILKIAREKGLAEYFVHNLHDYADDKYRHIDDYPFGGGAGMLIKCEPIARCIDKLKEERAYDEIIYMTADARQLTQHISNELCQVENIIVICGHYKGIDQRIRDLYVTREISIGDYVLSGGELPAAVLVDSIVRIIPGVIGDAESALDDSFQDGLLAAPMYTRPAIWRGMAVPEELTSGNHALINNWRREKSVEQTKRVRPDLLDKH